MSETFPPLASQLLPAPAPVAIGPDGPAVAPIAWGMWRFAGQSEAAAQALVEAALDAGITLFDTADIYGFGEQGFGEAEALLGRVFAASPGLRDRMVLATKGGITPPMPYDSSAAWLTRAIDDSLTRLQVERVELWQVHRPDILTHPQEVARSLETAHAAGKIGAIGVSNFTPAQIEALAHFLDLPLASNQPEFSPLFLGPLVDGQFDLAMRMGMATLAWSPLGGGRIAAPTNAREEAVAAALDRVAAAQGVSRTTAAFAWVMAHPARPIPIIGSQNAGRIREAATATQVRWTRTDWYNVLVAARGEPLP
ncbi:MAG: aldo/keto reductase [Sphingopyxis sp.]|nr:aldo/keto reductase [Sphingopyxis sp.]